MSDRIHKADDEWRAELTPEQYRITRKKGTEPAFTGEYHDTKTRGVYHCVCCDQPLYASDAKYDSGSGWPSFTSAIENEAIETQSDHTFGMDRMEVLCSRCGAHLGHVFPDGPAPTGMRHCINSAALRLKEEA